MEKIPYKPGDELWSEKLATKRIVLDLSQNGYVAFLDYKIGSYGNGYTKLDLDDDGFILKTPAKVEAPAKWVPEIGSNYYYLDDYGHCATDKWWAKECEFQIYRLKANNVFKTETEAIEARDKIMNTNEGVV